MNAGAFGREISQFLTSFRILAGRGEIRDIGSDQWHAGYRTMTIEGVELSEVLLLSARFSLSSGRKEEIAATMAAYRGKRRGKQQPGLPSAGSFFKNPQGGYAGRLIEEAGLKGLRVGGAMVAEEHANFIVNTGGATAADIIALMELVQEKVMVRAGIFLEPEVHIL
jgi:UDP-N-acetylmuramate dehydrogenase